MERLNDDIIRMVLRNVNVKTLLLLGKVCKRFQKGVRAKGLLHASMLNTFPGILDLPAGKEFHFYISGINRYYGMYHMGFKRSEFDVSNCIAVCITRRHPGYKPAPLSGIVNSVMNNLMLFLFTEVDRKFVIDRVNDWRASCSLFPGHFLSNAGDILDAISSIVLSNFCWTCRDGIHCFW